MNAKIELTSGKAEPGLEPEKRLKREHGDEIEHLDAPVAAKKAKCQPFTTGEIIDLSD